MKQSPYQDKPISEWKKITELLLKESPLDQKEIVTIILAAWDCIFESQICSLTIGKEIFPNPQMLGYFIETLTAAKLSEKYPEVWKHGKSKIEKDIVCITNNDYSIEVKSSSSSGQIFANRSYAQENSNAATKDKNGFYLTINFDKFEVFDGSIKPEITLIRFGFIEHTDWRAQKSEKGQQASLSPEVYKNKFIILFQKEKTKN